MTPKQRYDAKRKGTQIRVRNERARSVVRRSGLAKSGLCAWCGEHRKTVWHHTSYRDPLSVIELCYACHRAAHPR
jgi:hypothetical protein